MGQTDKLLNVQIIEPDERARSALTSVRVVGINFNFLSLPATMDQVQSADAVVVSVDCQSGIDLLASICGRPGMPPVIAIGGSGYGGKSLEFVLLLAELRGAAATLIKPFEAQDLALAVHAVCNLQPRADGSTQTERRVG
jgi:hypothetical protein